MNASIHQLIYTINAYQRLLERYARRLVKDPEAAALITATTFHHYAKQNPNIPLESLKVFLRNCIREDSRQWLAAKNLTLFQRKPKNPT